MSELNKALSLLNKAQEKDILSVYIPSLGTSVEFKPMVARHQKMLTKACFNPKELQTTVFEIIKELAPNDYQKFNTVDVNNIILSLRSDYIGSTIEVKGELIEIPDIIARNKTVRIETKPSVVVVEKNGVTFSVTIQPPSLEKDNALNIHLRDLLKEKDIHVSDALAEMVQLQLAGYICVIKVKMDDKEESIVFDRTFSLKQRLEVVSALNSSVLPDIFEAIKSFTVQANAFLTSDKGTLIPTDESFFIITKS